MGREKGRPILIIVVMSESLDGLGLEGRTAPPGFVGNDLAYNQGPVVTLECELSIPGDGVISGELEDGQGVHYNAVIGIIVDGVAAQAVEERAQADHDSNAGIAGDVDPAVNIGVGMVRDLDAASAVAIDLGDARPLAMAGFAAMHANAG